MSLILARSCYRCLSSTSREARRKSKDMVDSFLRVDHAGEFGAIRIYKGQMDVLGKTRVGPVIQHMAEQEEHHLETFANLLPKHRARPTLLMPVWNVAGYVLGAGTALLGKESAMACTVAVESVIAEHYDNQIRALVADGKDGIEDHKELIEIISKFRDEEVQHHDTGLSHDAEQAPLYNGLSTVIKVGCKAAIWLSERI